MNGRDLRRVARDLAARRPTSQAEAAERAHRGAALVRAALAGAPVPDAGELEETAPVAGRAPRFELVACGRCYAPHDGLPGSLCPTCELDAVDLTDLVPPPDPPPPP
jgi:hypothetical protein